MEVKIISSKMPDKKKSKDFQNANLQHENVLEALVVADSFDDRFLPVTTNKPEVSF